MKTELIMFQNCKEFKEYAVRYKKGIFSKWEFVKNDKGRNALFNYAGATAEVEKLLEENK